MKRLAVLTIAILVAATAMALAVSAFGATTVRVTAGEPSEFRFTLSKRTVSKGTVTFRVTNGGEVRHDFKIAGKKTRLIAPGRSATLKVKLKKRRYRYLCTVPGHADAGMKGRLRVR